MNHPARTAILATLAITACTLFHQGGFAVATQDAAPPNDPIDAPPTATAEVGDLKIVSTRDGTIDSASRAKIRFAPEAFSGSVKVAEVLHRIGPVTKDQVLLRLEPLELEKAARHASEALDDAERSFDLAQEERQIMLEQQKLALERSEWAAVAAQHAYEMFQKSESENMLLGAELAVQGQENNLSNQREELEQLEQMYKGTELSGETKEIVLDRARRGVRMTEQYLDIARDNLALTREFRHPDRQREITQQQRWSATDLELLKASQQLADIRSQASIQNAERSLRDARERVEKAQRDLQLVEIKSPFDGLINRIDVQPGDSMNAGAVVCEVIDPDHLIATFSAKEEDLRVLAPGSQVRITTPAFGEVALDGNVMELAAIGSPGNDGATFPARIGINGSHDLVRVGQKCTIHAEKTLSNVLRVPAKALTSRDARQFVTVIDPGGAKREVEVTIGARGGDMVQIISGLKAGDVVALPPDKPADGGQ
jgi:RND family efflux transporter MFP subunit